MKTWISLLSFALAVTGCVWDNEEDFYPEPGDCDTSMVSYAEDIVPILSSNCYSCHSNLNAPGSGGGLGLEDYGDVASNSQRIAGAINHSEGYKPMPRGGSKLDPCSITLFEAWMRAGTPGN